MNNHSTKLSVNINKLATLRNSRGKNNPDVVSWAQEIEGFGAHGITVHPRPDERHIRFNDVRLLKPVVRGEFNIEGYPDEKWLSLVEEVIPDQATLVPDPPEALTSNAGWKIAESEAVLAKVIGRLKKRQIRVSVFIEPGHFSEGDAKTLKRIGADRIELYTEEYALAAFNAGLSTTRFDSPSKQPHMKMEDAVAHEAVLAAVVANYKRAAELALHVGLGINAGHDLDLHNLRRFVTDVPGVAEVSIGHALVCDALRYGFKETIARYLACLK